MIDRIIRFARNRARFLNRVMENPSKTVPYVLKGYIADLNYFGADLMTMLGMYSYPHRVIFVAGLPKSGTTWVENFIALIPGYNPRILKGPEDVLARHDICLENLGAIPGNLYSAIKTHVRSQNLEVLMLAGINRIVVMYRDPRDMTISNYFHEKNHPADPLYEQYNRMSQSEGLAHCIETTIAEFIPWIAGWREKMKQDPAGFFEIRYEDLREHPRSVLGNMLKYYGINLSEKKIGAMLEKTKPVKHSSQTEMFKLNELKAKPGMRSTFRSGKVGEWRELFTTEHKKRFKEAAGQYLIDWGYEKDLNW